MSINTGFSISLSSINRQGIVAKITGIGAIFNITLNLILIPKFSYIGASIATVVTEVFVFLLLFNDISNNFYKLKFLRIMARPVFSVLCMCAVILFFKQINLILLILFSSVMYLCVLYLIGGLSQEDISLLKEIKLKRSDDKI
jgi:O-antigen/teichoic acid export membrane protein